MLANLQISITDELLCSIPSEIYCRITNNSVSEFKPKVGYKLRQSCDNQIVEMDAQRHQHTQSNLDGLR